MNRTGILIISPNWLGDVVMALPAVRALREKNPNARIAALAKKAVAPLWDMCGFADEIIVLPKGNFATFAMGDTLRGRGFETAYILPNSFRSALIAFIAGIPKRRGAKSGDWRRWMLNDAVDLKDLKHAHQSEEYGRILEVSVGRVSDPSIKINKTGRVGDPSYIVLIPGAARGDSKRWPFFAEAARLILKRRPQTRFLVCGAVAESGLCHEVAENIGKAAESVAGKTNLKEFAAILAGAELVVCNDSGGMHLASALGTPVVAVYGLTDPVKTGPIGANALVIRPEGIEKSSRDIARESAAAAAALRSITPERVAEAALWKLKVES